MDDHDVTRRNVLRASALGAVAVPLLVACGDGESTTGTPAGSTTPSTGSSGGPTQGGGGGSVLAKTSDIEVGGAVFLDAIVITQPAAGQFHAFDRTCTHQACPVTDLVDGKIHCSCHGSLYDAATGENVGGPAPKPLTEVEIKVQGGNIVEA
jgi:Rieske Fe-S protein